MAKDLILPNELVPLLAQQLAALRKDSTVPHSWDRTALGILLSLVTEHVAYLDRRKRRLDSTVPGAVAQLNRFKSGK